MEALLMLPVLLFSIITHEYAHGYVAYRFGDDTAMRQGRLTFNPVPHIDIFGSIIFPLILLITKSPFLIGWAKPVPVNPLNLRNPSRHHLYVSLAGIVANLMLAVICTLLYGIYINIINPSPDDAIRILFNYGIVINVILAVFNLIPIPPLDGSWVLYHLLPEDLANVYRKIFPYGFIILMLLLFTNVIHIIIIPVYSLIVNFLQMLLSTIVQ
jgi:Zn-dependent protease